MYSIGVAWAVLAGTAVGLLVLLLQLRVAARRRVPSRVGAGALAGEPEAVAAGPAPTEAVRGESVPSVKPESPAEKAYAERVRAAEREFNARKERADLSLRAAEIFLEHAQRYGGGPVGADEPFRAAVSHAARLGESLDERRGRRILYAREHLADAMLEHRLTVAAAQQQVADIKAQRDVSA